ncbi:exonuclease domain-containing protein [Thermodesulfobacteriota bacterium]
MINKKQPLNETTFVAFDLETTGLMPVVNRIVEIGAVKFNSEAVIDTFQELIDPKMPISPGASAVNGITDDMVAGKRTIEQVLPQFVSFVGDDISVAHNAPFDVGFLSYDISRLNLEPTDQPILDTCVIPKRVFPGLYSYSLENLARSLRIKSKEFHRALADAEACMEIFRKCLDEMGDPDRLTLQDILDVNGPALDFNPGEITLDEGYFPLKEAMESGTSVEIVYQDASGAITVRHITPLSLGLGRNIAMLEAFCHLRQDTRNFRLDRILEIR